MQQLCGPQIRLEPARGADHGLHPVLVLAPDFHGHAGFVAFALAALDRAVHRQRVSDDDGLDERYRDLPAFHETYAGEIDHQLRDVSGGHERLRERRAEAFLARPLEVGVYRVRAHARIAVDLALRDRLRERSQLGADFHRLSGSWFHGALLIRGRSSG